MPIKKKKRKSQTQKPLGRNKDLPEPIVIETTSPLTEEQQNENPLNKKIKNANIVALPDGFKTADSMTEVDDLKFENGRLRELLVSWLDRVSIDGAWYQVMADPLNRALVITREK